MNNILSELLGRYNAVTLDQKKCAMREIIQEIVLCGLARGGFFDKAAFYGGTALRIFYGLDRYSEDLDFSLKEPDADFQLSSYFPVLEKEISAFGLQMTVEEKMKSQDSAVKSAFLKGDTKEHLLIFYAASDLPVRLPTGEKLKIKFEVDTNPPPGAEYQHKYRVVPMPYGVCLYDTPSLFAGKLHAVLCRGWKNRVKGRDLYDYIFYLQMSANVNLGHLKQRMIQSGNWNPEEELTMEKLKERLRKHFDEIDYESAKLDARDFVRDPSVLDIWSPDFFKAITEELK